MYTAIERVAVKLRTPETMKHLLIHAPPFQMATKESSSLETIRFHGTYAAEQVYGTKEERSSLGERGLRRALR